MNKNHLKVTPLLSVRLNGEDLTLCDVFVTGDAIAFWKAETGSVIDLASWHWHKNSDGESGSYIVTGK